MNKTISIVIGALMIVCIGGFVYLQKVSDSKAPDQANPTTVPYKAPAQTTQTVTTPLAQVVASGISSADVAKHSSRTSCWSAINGNVYDLTSWIPQHPGGEENILILCGINGSDAYNGQHGGSRKTTAILSGFKVGVAAN